MNEFIANNAEKYLFNVFNVSMSSVFNSQSNHIQMQCILCNKKKRIYRIQVIRQPYFTDRLVIKVKEPTLYAVYLNEFNMPVTAFTLQCSEAQVRIIIHCVILFSLLVL